MVLRVISTFLQSTSLPAKADWLRASVTGQKASADRTQHTFRKQLLRYLSPNPFLTKPQAGGACRLAEGVPVWAKGKWRPDSPKDPGDACL